ncbi:hypothetical protein D3C73_1316100 [compost metagenome]
MKRTTGRSWRLRAGFKAACVQNSISISEKFIDRARLVNEWKMISGRVGEGVSAQRSWARAFFGAAMPNIRESVVDRQSLESRALC